MACKALPLLLLALLATGCARSNPVAPADVAAPPAAARGETLVLGSPADPRLPAPGAEEAALAPGDRALLDTAPAADAAALPAILWNDLTTELADAARLPAPSFARAYALVHAGLYDALVVGRERAREGLPVRSLAAGVAYEVLRYLFPAAGERIAAAAAGQVALDAPGAGGRALGAWALGRAVGRLAVRRGMSDGSDATWSGDMPVGDGLWSGTNPVLPMAGAWRTWIVDSGAEFPPEPPYAFGSPADQQDVQEVLEVSRARTPEQIAAVHKWADRAPPAIWNGMLNERLAARGLDGLTAARAQAFLNVAMADAFINCWAAKYRYWEARPFQRIPGLTTVIPTPNFPSYTSGHSTISAAAAVVLGEVFPDEAAHFRAEAEEAAMSRLWAGIHFRHDNEQGFRCGEHIGETVVAAMRAGGRLRLAAGAGQ